jgi:hypothetical protein
MLLDLLLKDFIFFLNSMLFKSKNKNYFIINVNFSFKSSSWNRLIKWINKKKKEEDKKMSNLTSDFPANS